MFWDKFNSLCISIGKKPNPVGKEIGVSSATISKWKAGATPNGEILVKIADYFNVSTDFLLGRSAESQSNTGHFNENDNIQIDTNSDSLKKEFLKAFDNLSFQDKVEIMNVTIQKNAVSGKKRD